MLTKKKKQILDYLKGYIRENSFAPSLEEIKKHFKLSSISTIHQHIRELTEMGYLDKDENQPRSIQINKNTKNSDLVAIPLLGTIAAGQPIEAIEIPEETIAISKNDVGKFGNHYALRVQGNSMMDEGIFDGDIVIIREQKSADDGQTVVAIIDDNQATLKKIYREKNRFKLQPANQNLLPFYRKEVEIRGTVIKIIRNINNGLDLEEINLNNPFFTSQLITYIGNKRKLLPFLYKGFSKIRNRVGKNKLVILDGFVGGGSTARLLKYFASELHVNDLEDYSETINHAYLANKSSLDLGELEKYIRWLNANKLKRKQKNPGFIEKNYAPKNDDNIGLFERAFYTSTNAKIIDNLRALINEIPEKYREFCLASLLVKASIHTNTSGVFKGFHKRNGRGHFGGNGENALSRIKRDITLDVPILSDFECKINVHKEDINTLVRKKTLPFFDLVYYDPPYNQHPYGSNYFMLNIINNEGKGVEIQNGVSGITKDWNRSSYNKRGPAKEAMDQLLSDTNSRFIAISYNNEGIIPIDIFKRILSKHGKWELMEQDYNTYRGSRNLRDRNIKVKELLWILEKKAVF